MSLWHDRRLLVAVLLLAISAVESNVISMYPGGGSYLRTPLYCDTNSRYTTLNPTTACYHRLTRDTCCMRSFTKSGNGIIQQECLCGPSNNNEARVTASTQTTSSTTTTTTTTASTSTTTPRTASTTTTRIPSTTTTTTTTASTSTTTPRTASTTTTRIPSTTAPFQSLCLSSSFRIMNGDVVDDHCQFSGVANITQGDGTIQSCSAVYTRVKVNGVLKPTFLTSRACKEGIERVTKADIKTEILIGNQAYPVTSDMFHLVEGPNGTAFVDIVDRYARLLTDLDTCQKLACPYNKIKMEGLLDFDDCKIVSWGATSAVPAIPNAGLHEAAIKLVPQGCSKLKNLFGAANTMCFRTISGAKLFSQGDSGAPVYCKATSNGEWILVGVAAEQMSWGSTPDLKVIPYPE